jgi:hypothetical protein
MVGTVAADSTRNRTIRAEHPWPPPTQVVKFVNRRLTQAAAVSALALLASFLPIPAYAADSLTITVDPVSEVSGGTLTVDGDASPDCVAAGTYDVTLTYTRADGETATAAASGVLPAVNSVFSTELVIPEDARAGGEDDAPASITATATCDGETTTSQTEQVVILFHEGEVTVEPATVLPGESFTVSGTECYGGRYEILIVPAGEDVSDAEVVAAADLADGVHNFSVELTVDDEAPAGDYEVYAFCAGSNLSVAALTVEAAPLPPGGPRPTATPTATPTSTAPPAAAPTPVEGVADFTG